MDDNNLSNDELLDLIEHAASQYLNNVKEFVIRLKEKKVTEEENERFVSIGENTLARFIDWANIDSKYEIKDATSHAISRAIDKVYDKNR